MKLTTLTLTLATLTAAAQDIYYLPDGELVGTGAQRPSRKQRAAVPTVDTRRALRAVLPASVDNSTSKWFPPIRSQGSLGSCSQFAAVYYTFTYMNARLNNLDAKGGGDMYRFSPKWTYNMVNGGRNTGSQIYDAFNIARKNGLCTWLDFPYNSNYKQWCLNSNVWDNALTHKVDKWGTIRKIHTAEGLATLKQYLANGYVLNFSTYINSWKWGAFSNDLSTAADDAYVGKAVVEKVYGTTGGHSMTIVGYNDNLWFDVDRDGTVDAGEKGALRIANSWGTTWVDGGYTWLSYYAICKMNPSYSSEGVLWFNEAMWADVRPAYTPRLVAKFRVHHKLRNQMVLQLGVSSVNETSPTTTQWPYMVFNQAGGPYAFDGTTTAISGNFCLDFTDLLVNRTGPTRLYMGIRDTTTTNLLTLIDYSIYNPATGEEVHLVNPRRQVDKAETYVYIDQNL